MSTSRVPLRGNKLFLPKIQFHKLGNKPLSNVLQLNENSTDSEDLSDADDGEKLTTASSEVMPVLHNEVQCPSFTRFNVLPPIPGRRYSPRNFEESRLTASLSSIPDKQSVSGDASGKRTRRTNYLTRQKATIEVDTEVVDESRKSSPQREELRPRAKSQSNKHFQRSYSETNTATQESVAPVLSISDFSLERKGLASKRCKICSVLGPTENDGSCSHRHRVWEESIDRSLQSTTSSGVSRTRINETVSRLRYFNSEGISANSKNSGSTSKTNTLILPKNEEKLDFPGLEKRPLSRCQIDLDLNEMEYSAVKTQKDQNGNDKISFKFDTCNVSSSSIRVPSEDSDLFSVNNSGNSMNFLSPQIQILVESIDDAKEDLQKQTLGVPFTSTREQRRRSALCRNNTKQVDDFLLVHNLRDLGLL